MEWRLSVFELLSSFDCHDPSVGLSSSSVESLQKVHGPNKMEVQEEESIFMKYIDQFKEPLILMLLGSACLSVIVGQYEDAISITMAVIIVGTVAFIQEYRSEQSLESLNSLVPPHCHVVRSGKTIRILAEELVPGDIVKLTGGDRVPADGRIIMCNDFRIDESSLTGEAEPREKIASDLPDLADDAPIAERHNMVFMGSLVSSGNATILVTKIGASTEFGKTFQDMKEVESRRSPLQLKMDELGQQLSYISFTIIIIIALVGVFQGKSFMTMFNIGVSLAVAAIPEGLPICVTVTLALGVIRMARKQAIVKKLPAVESLGCADIICTDKTGTLTQNKMTVVRLFCLGLEDCVYHISATPASMHDWFSTSSSSSSSTSSSSLETTIVNPFSYLHQPLEPHRFPCVDALLDGACLCNNAHLHFSSMESKQPSIVGQPMEGALLLAASQLEVADRREKLARSLEIPFSSDNKMMEVRYTEVSYGGASQSISSSASNITSIMMGNYDTSSDLAKDNQNHMNNNVSNSHTASLSKELIVLKGALEIVLPRCSLTINSIGEKITLSHLHRDRLQQQALAMANEGLRVLAVACGYHQPSSSGNHHNSYSNSYNTSSSTSNLNGNNTRYGNQSNSSIYCFLGLIGLMDPLREGAAEAVHRIRSCGSRVIMITGDALETAVAIASMAGIEGDFHDYPISSSASMTSSSSSSSSSTTTNTTTSSSSTATSSSSLSSTQKVLSGQEIEDILRVGGEEALGAWLEHVSLCYRTSPRHKLSIVRSLQARNHVVAMTGDGVNDAPALKAAQIGVAMGSGTDVAKEAAAMVLLDDNFATLVTAIEEGKSIFANLKNFLTFQLSTSVAALGLVAVHNLLGLANPLNPMQILWINIIMDGPLAQSLGLEVVDPLIVKRPPRPSHEEILTKPLLARVMTTGILMLLMTSYIFSQVHSHPDSVLSTVTIHPPIAGMEVEEGVRAVEASSLSRPTLGPRELSMIFTGFVFLDLMNAWTCRHGSRPVTHIGWMSNPTFLIAVAFCLSGQLLLLYFPPLQGVFKTVPLSGADLLYLVLLSMSVVVLDTIRKYFFPQYFSEISLGDEKPPTLKDKSLAPSTTSHYLASSAASSSSISSSSSASLSGSTTAAALASAVATSLPSGVSTLALDSSSSMNGSSNVVMGIANPSTSSTTSLLGSMSPYSSMNNHGKSGASNGVISRIMSV